MELTYTYWDGEGGSLVWYLDNYPSQWTQGKNVAELEEMLLDLYINFQEEAKVNNPRQRRGLERRVSKRDLAVVRGLH